MRTKIKFLSILVITLSIVSCGPRGESLSVDQILTVQKDKYSNHLNSSQVNSSLLSNLNGISAALDLISSEGGAKQVNDKAKVISENLSDLIVKAGYTSRPALSELVTQYRVIASGAGASDKPATIKLLVARTYSALASELETTKFQL